MCLHGRNGSYRLSAIGYQLIRKVWREAHALGCDVYRIARELPPTDRSGLGDQLRRASISIGADIAEGCGRNGDRESSRFLNIALGSASELQHLLQFARDVDILPPSTAGALIDRAGAVARMLAALHCRHLRPPP